MEGCVENLDVFSVFYSCETVLQYFSEFYNLLQDLKCDVMLTDISKFIECLKYLDQTIFSQANIKAEKVNEFESILLKIFDTLSQKYLNKYAVFDKISEGVFRITILFDAISLLIKIIVVKFRVNVHVEHIFLYIKDCLLKYQRFENYSNADESEQEELQHIFIFFISILQSISFSDISKYISNEDLIQILNLIPLSNKYVVNIFLNKILPCLYSMCDHTFKTLILELLWKKIVFFFEENSFVGKEPYFYSLLCCFFEYMSKEHCKPANFNIMDDIPWKIIESGLTSNNSLNRKQTLYVFKLLRFSLKFLFSSIEEKNLLIWNDLISLFEILEEKQVHLIKPVLPKFSRILQHSSKHSPLHDMSNFLHPAWITCLIRRMIYHESKFVIKQGLSIAMNINFNDCHINYLESEKFIDILVRGFNDQTMYCRMHENDNLSLFLTSEKILDFFIKYIAAFEAEEQKFNFLVYLLKLIASESWCGVALLHLTFALSNLKSLPSWKSDDIIYLRKIQGFLKSHEPIIRTTVERWLLKCCILFIDWRSLCLEEISELLFIFNSLERHTIMWNAVVLKLKEIFTTECSNNLSINEAEKYCLNCIKRVQTGNQSLKETDLQKISRLFMLLADSSIISCDMQDNTFNWCHLLQPLTSIITDAPKRPYMSQEMFFNVLHFYTLLIGASQGSIRDTSDGHTFTIIKCLNCSTEFIEFIYQKSFMDIKCSNDIINFQILCNALYVFSSLAHINELFIKILPSVTVKYNSVPEDFLSKKIIIILFYSISAYQFNETKCKKLVSNLFSVLSSSLLSKIINEHVINDLSKSVFVNEFEKELWLKLATKSICNFWNVTSHVISYLSSPDLQLLLPAVVQLAQSMFDGGSKSTYTSIINCIQILVPKLGIENMDVIQDLLNSAWKACLELHGCEAYRPAVSSFIKAIFQSYMLSESCFDILYKYLNCFQNLSENTLGIFYIVIKQFCNTFSLKSLFDINFNCIPIIIHALTYGPIHHKSQKILEDTVTYISEQDEHFSIEFKNYDKPSIFVRVVITTYLMKHLYKSDSESEKISLEIMNNLLVLDDSTRSSKSSKFANSYSHRVRTRIWQTILLLQPNLTREENEKFLKRVIDLLEFDNQQPSIRYLQEWFVLKTLNDHPYFLESFISRLENSLEKRPGFLVSLLSVLSHLIIHDIMVSEDHAYKCFPVLINCSMAQNFAVRLYSRLGIIKLLSFCKKKKFTSLTQKYDFLHSILQSPKPENILFEKGNVYKNLLKLQEDFYFAQFHPVHHFTLETIFYELPRLSNIASEEWIKPIHYQDHLGIEFEEFLIPCFNTDDCLKSSIANVSSDKSVEESLAIENDSFYYNFQKKICPTRFENSDCDIDLFIEKKPKQNDLIVVASLIDKIPNLGGLCRTCEVFGVKEFIIGSLKYSEDKQFQNLAVSADRWVSIKEVKPYNLKEYLLSLKEEGYTLVGAEQTDDSHSLTDYIFPKKSALLLGHEKEGIPVDLIWLLDACVEIPQQGIIRSLNVHVSGAVFIWEYSRQQIKQPT